MRKAITADDSSVQLNINKSLLIKAGYEVVGTARNGQEALKLIRDLAPDLALLDYAMSPCTGAEVVKAVTDEGLSTKCVFATASGQRAAAYALGIPVLVKPFNLTLFHAAVWQAGIR